MKIDPTSISLRAACDNDRLFAFAVKKAAFRVYIEPIWGWDEAFQIEFHKKDWDEHRPEIIRLGERDIGTIEIWRRKNDIHLGEFYLFPEFQKQGIGSHFMTLLVKEADSKGVPVLLEVIKINPVQALYSRFGFSIIGETRTHYQMKKEPKTSEPTTRAAVAHLDRSTEE
jgi:GNAT superfamily N-acetyltransferase